jgi:hypothetical protein
MKFRVIRSPTFIPVSMLVLDLESIYMLVSILEWWLIVGVEVGCLSQ